MISRTQANLALEVEYLQGSPLDAGITKSHAGGGVRRDLQAERGRRRHLHVSQERTDLFDRKITIGLNLVLNIENNLRGIVLAKINRQVALYMPDNPAKLCELGVIEYILPILKQGRAARPVDLDHPALVNHQEIPCGKNTRLRAHYA